MALVPGSFSDGDNSKNFTFAVEPSAIRSDQSSETATSTT